MKIIITCFILMFLVISGCLESSVDKTSDSQLTASMMSESEAKMEKATFGAGCFWGVEATFRKLEGVASTSVGYTGGETENPTYREVCSDTTGHAEVVQVVFDPEKISYDQLLEVFWTCHNPTQVNRQGPDVGRQYRSVIFFHDEKQKELAAQSKKQLDESGKFSQPIATEIEPAQTYYIAEDYHQQYLEKRGLGSCQI